MNIVTGEELGYLKVPTRSRRQFYNLMAYLRERDPARQTVCALDGLRRTGKTTLILQAVRELISQGTDPETIGYFTGQKEDAFDDLIIELEARKKLEYISPRDRGFRMKRTETVALLDFLTHCGVITVLPNASDDAEPYRCYVQTPFLRFHFTEKLHRMVDGVRINENTPLFGNLLEAAVVSEYQDSHPEVRTCFARTHYPPGSGEVAEIDLLDMDHKIGYEVKLRRSRGYRGFDTIGSLPELAEFQFEMLKDSACVERIYQWGRKSYHVPENV